MSKLFLELSKGAPIQLFLEGDFLMRQGDQGGHCYVIEGGSVQISAASATGVYRTLGTRGVGDLVGETSLFRGKRCADVRAITDCQCARISHPALLQLLSSQPELAIVVLSTAFDRLAEGTKEG